MTSEVGHFETSESLSLDLLGHLRAANAVSVGLMHKAEAQRGLGTRSPTEESPPPMLLLAEGEAILVSAIKTLHTTLAMKRGEPLPYPLTAGHHHRGNKEKKLQHKREDFESFDPTTTAMATMVMDSASWAVRGATGTSSSPRPQASASLASSYPLLEAMRAAAGLGGDHDKINNSNGGGQENSSSAESSLLVCSEADLQACLALSLNNLACIYRRMEGREGEGLQCLEETAEIETHLYGKPRCSTLLNVCTVLIAIGRADEAVPIAKECVELAKVNRENSTSNTSKFSPPPATADDVDTINSNNIITNANAQQGNEGKGKEEARKGNNHQHHQVPPPPPEQLTVALHNLSVAQQHSSESSERQAAGSTMRLAYDEALAVLGEHHPTTERIRIKLLGDAANKTISTANPPSSRRPTQTSQGQAHLPFGTSGSSSLRPSPPATASSEARGSTVHNSLRGERKAEEAPRSAALRALNAKSRSLIPDSDLAAAVALAAGFSSRQPTMYKSPSRDRNSGSASNSPARASVSPHLYHQGGPSTSTTGITGSDTHYHHQHPFSDGSNDQYYYSLINNDNDNNNNKNWDASQKDNYDKEKRNGLGTNEEAEEEEEEAIGSGERLPMTEGDDLSSSAGVHVDAAHTSQSGPQVLAASSSPLPNPSNPPKLSVLERYNILVKENAPRLNPPLSTAVRRPNTSPRPSREAALLPTTTLLPNSNFTFNFSGPRNSSAQFSSRQRLPKGAAAAMLYNPPPAPPKGLNGGQASDTSNVSRKASNAPQQQQQDGGGPLVIDAMMSQIPEKKSASEKRVEDPSSSTAAAAGETPEGGGGLDANKNAKRRPSRASIVVSDLFDQGAKKAEDNVSSSLSPSSRRESAENNRKAADALLLLAQSSSAATKGAAFEYYDSLPALSSSSFVRFLSAEKIQSVPIPISFTEVKQEMAAERKRLEELRRVRHRTKAILARGLGGGTDHTVVGLGIPLDSPQQSPRGEHEDSEQRSIGGGSKATNGSTTALNGTNKTRPTAVEAYVRNTYRAAKGSMHMNVYDRKADQSHSDASAIPSFTGGEESEPQPPSTATVGTAANAASRPKAAMLSVAARRAQRLQEEAAEEQRLRGQRKRIDDQLKREAERRHQLQRLAEARRHRAVIAIQRAWREWWRKSGIVRKRAVDSLRGGIGAGVGIGRRLLAGSPRSRNKSQQLFGGDGGIPRVFPALLRCAQKWLAKTAGRRFVARLLKEKLSTPADVVAVTAQITKIQCAFRCFMARQALARRRANANAVIALRGEYERRHTAASTIQRAYRRLSGRLWVANERLAYILSFVRLMQRMGRGFCGRITVFNKQHNEVVTRYKSAVTIQRNWRGYLGRLRASMARIRLKCDGKEGAERIVRSRAMIEKALADARARREEEERKMLDDTEPSATVGSAMLAYARDVDPSPITLELIRTIRAEKATRDLLLQREAEEASAKEELRRLEEERWLAGAEERAKEQYKREALERHGGVGGIGERLAREEAVAKEAYHELNARQLEAELRERFYAPNATDAIKLRAVEGHMRDLELATFTENRAATLIQRRVRRWLKLIRIDEAAAYAYKYRRGECEKRLYAKKEIAVAERAALLAARTNIGDLSAPIRADRETLENEAAELSRHVRLRLESKEAVRSAVDRNRDAKVLALMEAQLEERKAQDAAFLRSSASFAGGKFLTARERMRLGATTSSPTLGEEGQPALGVVDIAGSSSSSFSTSARQNEQEDERADNMGSCAV